MVAFALPPEMGMELVERYLLNPVGEPPVVALHPADLPALAGGDQVFPDPYAAVNPRTGRRERTIETCGRTTPTGKKRAGFKWSPAARNRKLIVVASSGGIDSTALLVATRRKYPRAMLLIERADTGHEPPDTMETLRLISRHVRAPVVNLLPPRSLWELIQDRGEIPNLAGSFKSCTLAVKGNLLDRFNCWIVRNRKNRTTVHLSGLLFEEPKRVYTQLFSQRSRFGDLMEEEALLYDERISKAKAIRILQKAGVPLSSTYLDRLRHGCIPCKYWQENEWQRYLQVDPEGFKAASDLEQYIETHGRRKASDKFPAGSNFAKIRRIWLTGRADVNPDGLFLTEWVRLWDREEPGWRSRAVPAGLVRPEDIDAPTATRKIGSKVLPVMGQRPLPPTAPALAQREAARAKSGSAKWHAAVEVQQNPRSWKQALKALKKEQGQRAKTPFPLPAELDLSEIKLGPWTATPDQVKPRWESQLKLYKVTGPSRATLSIWVRRPPGRALTAVRLKAGRKFVGHVVAEKVRHDGEWRWVVVRSHLDETLRDLGLGSLLYLAAKATLQAYEFQPVSMIPTAEYLKGTGTSPQAMKVWTRLRGEGRLARTPPGAFRPGHRGAVVYVSPRMRPLTREEAGTRRVAYALRKGHGWAVRKATQAMSPHVRSSDLLVPIPNSKGDTSANLKLAYSLAQATGAGVADVLGRYGSPVESNRERHIAGLPPLTIMEHCMTRDPALGSLDVAYVSHQPGLSKLHRVH